MELPARILTLQRADRWIGVPLCAMLTVLRRILGSRRPLGPQQVRRILFVKFAEQGSTVLAHSAIRRAIEMVGRENVYFVVFEDDRVILDLMEIISERNVITIPTRSLAGLAAGTVKAVSKTRKVGIEGDIDLNYNTRISDVLRFESGAD